MRKNSYSNVLRKTVATSLVACMAVSMTGCGSKKSSTTDGSNVTTKPSGSASSDNQGSEGTQGENLSYTFNDYSAGSPKTWNVHEWETSEDSYIMTLTEMGLYDFGLNATKDGYEIIPEMAAAEPVDVTSEYAGNEVYGVPSDVSEGYAFKIALNENACWQDGTPINADTYIYSMEQMLNPDMKNYRASSYTSGNLILANASKYYNSGQEVYSAIYDGSGYRDVADADMFFSFTQQVAFFGDSAETYYNNASYQSYFMDADGNDLFAKYSEKDYYELTDEAKADILAISAAFGDTNPEAYKEWCFTFDGVSEKVSFDAVGLIKTGDYEITLVLQNPISDFYLLYSLSSNWIVNKDVYEANKKETGNLTKTTYGTSVDKYMAYGPYKLTEFQLDKQITLEKNDKWYGYTDGKHEGQFQTTKVNCQVVEAQATALQLFLQGKLDTVSLVADDMESYRSSDYIVFTPQTFTSKITFNSSKEALKDRETKGINRAILSYREFRKGLSLAIDRADFAAQCTATHKAGFGIFNYNYVSDPSTGELYRNTPQAKAALTAYYGVESEDQITGYDKEQAAQLITSAYNDALAKGDINEGDTVELEFLVYNNDDALVKVVNYIQKAFSEAAVGTPLEDKIKVKMTADPDYYDHAQQGQFEMIISTWGGSSMDPFGITECYADEGKLFEYGFKPKKTKLTIDINGESITKSFYDWYDALCNGEYAVADVNTRVTILAAMEQLILDENCTTPLYYRTSASLSSRKVIQGTDTYVQIVGFGGIRAMTYAFDDAAWDAYCTENNNQLTY